MIYNGSLNQFFLKKTDYQIYYQDYEGWKHQDFGQLFIVR